MRDAASPEKGRFPGKSPAGESQGARIDQDEPLQAADPPTVSPPIISVG